MVCAVVALASLHIGEAAAQTSEKSRMDQATQKMKVSEDPSSPGMQQTAAKQASCKKEAKAKLAVLKVGVGYPDKWPGYEGLRSVQGRPGR